MSYLRRWLHLWRSWEAASFRVSLTEWRWLWLLWKVHWRWRSTSLLSATAISSNCRYCYSIVIDPKWPLWSGKGLGHGDQLSPWGGSRSKNCEQGQKTCMAGFISGRIWQVAVDGDDDHSISFILVAVAVGGTLSQRERGLRDTLSWPSHVKGVGGLIVGSDGPREWVRWRATWERSCEMEGNILLRREEDKASATIL